jgi:MFS family permease
VRLLQRSSRRIFYGWWIVVGAFLLQGLGGGLLFNSFGAYFVYFQEEFGWSRTLIAGAISVSRLQSGILGPAQGWLINRFGPRRVIFLGLLLFGGGFMLLAQTTSVGWFYGSLLLVALGSNLAGFLTVNIVLVNWFERFRARAIALGAMGSSVAGLLVPVVAWSLATLGWRATAFYSGLLVFAVGGPVAVLFRAAPEPYGYAPDGRAPAIERQPTGSSQTPDHAAARPLTTSQVGMSAHDALHSPAFWLLTGGHTAALVAVSSITVLLIPYLVEQLGTSVETAAAVIAGLTGVSVLGHLVGGYLGDRIEKRLISATCMVGHTLALVMIIAANGLPLIIAGAMLHGLCWGTRGPLMMAMRADYFGRRAFATIEGFAAIITTAGLFLGPLIVGYVADQVGDYRPGFALLAVITAAGCVSFLLARRPPLQATRVQAAVAPGG